MNQGGPIYGLNIAFLGSGQRKTSDQAGLGNDGPVVSVFGQLILVAKPAAAYLVSPTESSHVQTAMRDMPSLFCKCRFFSCELRLQFVLNYLFFMTTKPSFLTRCLFLPDVLENPLSCVTEGPWVVCTGSNTACWEEGSAVLGSVLSCHVPGLRSKASSCWQS